MKVCFVTENQCKWQSALKTLSAYGIEVEQAILDTPEIQSENSREIAEYSAKYAAEKLGKPAVVTDVCWNFHALKGFPGPFAKYINKWFTAKDYIALMKGKKDMTITCSEFLSYCQPGKEPITFESTIKGKFSPVAKGNSKWALDQVFIPEGFEQTAAEIDEKTMDKFWAEKPTHWKQLAEFLKKEGIHD